MARVRHSKITCSAGASERFPWRRSTIFSERSRRMGWLDGSLVRAGVPMVQPTPVPSREASLDWLEGCCEKNWKQSSHWIDSECDGPAARASDDESNPYALTNVAYPDRNYSRLPYGHDPILPRQHHRGWRRGRFLRRRGSMRRTEAGIPRHSFRHDIDVAPRRGRVERRPGRSIPRRLT